MIRARDILEEYKTLITYGRVKAEVFSNPTQKELYGLGDAVRFTADPEIKVVYVLNANLFVHDVINKYLGYGSRWDNKLILPGEAIRRGASYLTIGSDSLDRYPSEENRVFMAKFFRQDWAWVEKYISVKGFIERLKNRFKGFYD